MSFKILEIDELNRSMVIDWGWGTYNHSIPDIFLQGEVHEEESKRIIATLEPDKPPQGPGVAQVLKDLVAKEIVEDEGVVLHKPDWATDVTDESEPEEI